MRFVDTQRRLVSPLPPAAWTRPAPPTAPASPWEPQTPIRTSGRSPRGAAVVARRERRQQALLAEARGPRGTSPPPPPAAPTAAGCSPPGRSRPCALQHQLRRRQLRVVECGRHPVEVPHRPRGQLRGIEPELDPPGDALPLRRSPGRVAPAGPEGPRLLNRSPWTATRGRHPLSVGFRPLPQTTRSRAAADSPARPDRADHEPVAERPDRHLVLSIGRHRTPGASRM